MALGNIEVRQGLAEELPATSESVDVAISNGVIDLCPDKAGMMKDVFRMLKPGGRFQIPDIVVHRLERRIGGRR